MKTKLLAKFLFLFCLGFVQIVYGQLNYLKSGAFNIPGTYTDLGTNGNAVLTANFDNANSTPQNIGFTFNYNGTAFTQFILNTNGFIKLGNTTPSIDSLFFTTGNGVTGGVFNSTDPADTNILCVFNHDLKSGTGTPEYRVYTSGTSGSQICTIQFKNVREKTITPAIQYDNMEFQIKLYETTNTIEFIYGTWSPSATGSSANKSSAIGLKGLDNTTPQLLVATKVSTQQWTSTTFLSGNYPGTPAFNFGKPASRPIPDVGRTFRFVQAFPNDAYVKLFTLGSIPKPYGAPRIDSAIVRNIGLNPLTNISVTLNITGANTFTDNQIIPSLAPGAYATVGFAPYTPTALGKNIITADLTADDNNLNNSDTYSQVVNNTIFSYADSAKAAGGISGQFAGYMLTKYNITGTTSVTSANIYISNDPASIGKNVYAILFDDLGNKLDSSAVLTIAISDTGKYHNFLLPLTPTISNASFYIGLAQPAIGYNALGYQNEAIPVRLGAYFYRQMNLSTFTELGGISSVNPYRLMIQAVITNTTGVLENVSENTVIVYPNPFNNTATFKIRSEKVADFSFDLYDVTGKIVKTIKNITSSEFQLERESLENGIYFYTISSSENIVDSGKLIIQ